MPPTGWVYATGTDPDTAIVGEATGGGVANSWAYTGGAASGSLSLHVPAGASPGNTYELRLFSNNSYTGLAASRSAPIFGIARSDSAGSAVRTQRFDDYRSAGRSVKLPP